MSDYIKHRTWRAALGGFADIAETVRVCSEVSYPLNRLWIDIGQDMDCQVRLESDGSVYLSYRCCNLHRAKTIPINEFLGHIKAILEK